jgi:hypothetical protein
MPPAAACFSREQRPLRAWNRARSAACLAGGSISTAQLLSGAGLSGAPQLQQGLKGAGPAVAHSPGIHHLGGALGVGHELHQTDTGAQQGAQAHGLSV